MLNLFILKCFRLPTVRWIGGGRRSPSTRDRRGAVSTAAAEEGNRAAAGGPVPA